MKNIIILICLLFTSLSLAQTGDISRRIPGPIQPIPSDPSSGGGGSAGYEEITVTETVSGLNFASPASVSELRVVESSGGELSLSGQNCFGAGPFTGGQTVVLIGSSDTNFVTLNYSDTMNGCIINGTASLQRFRSLTFVYNSVLARWIETTRNF